MQVYSDKSRENNPTALPDVEVWSDFYATIICSNCGEYTVPYTSAYVGSTAYCPECERRCDRRYNDNATAWWYWFCLPGCMPTSDPIGPFETEAEALADAQSE